LNEHFCERIISQSFKHNRKQDILFPEKNGTDNKLFIKPTESGRTFIQHVVEAPPYEGAKPSFLIENKLDDREWLSELIRISLKELPEPKAKKKKKKS